MFKGLFSFVLAIAAVFALGSSAFAQSNPDVDQLGDWMPRYWQKAGTPQRCGPYQPWGVSRQCPAGNPTGMQCNGVPHGTLCFGYNSGFYNFYCPALPGHTPSPTNAWFDMYVCP